MESLALRTEPLTPYYATEPGYVGGAVAVVETEVDAGGAPLSKLTEWYRSYQDSKTAEMDEQRVSRKYYHGVQWTAEEVRVLTDRKQPPITINRLGRKIDGIVGVVERLRQDPKASPRTPEHDQGADLATKTLRFAADKNRFADIGSDVAFDLAVEGIGGCEFSLEASDDGSYDPKIERVLPQTFFYDPRSVKPDFSDARFMGVAKWMDFEAAAELLPERRDALRQAMVTYGREGDATGLRDWEKNWYDTRLDRVLIVHVAYKWRGEWMECLHTGHIKLVGGASPFRDEKGKTLCRFRMTSAQVDQDGDRYSFIRNLKGPQDEVNHRRSALLHTIHSNRVIAEKEAVEDVEEARRQLNRRDGWVEKERDAFLEIIPPNVQMQGQAELLAEAKSEIENFGGANPALAGGQGQENRSGRAIALMQQAAIAELGRYLVRFKAWKLDCYRMIWNAVRVGWTTERFVRISDDPEQVQFIAINQPVMNAYGLPAMDEYGREILANAIGELDVDIILDEGPDTITLREEIQEQVKEMVNAKMLPPAAYFDVAPMPADVKKIVQKYTAPQEPDPAAQARETLTMQDAQATIRQKNARAVRDEMSAAKTAADADRVGFENEVVTARFAPQPAF